MRQVAARDLVANGADSADERARAGRMLTAARGELPQELLPEQQEHGRRQLADAARSGEDALAGVVRSVATIGRRFVLTVSASAREFTPIG